MAIFINENGIKKQLTAEEETAFNAQVEIDKTHRANKKIADKMIYGCSERIIN